MKKEDPGKRGKARLCACSFRSVMSYCLHAASIQRGALCMSEITSRPMTLQGRRSVVAGLVGGWL